MYFGGLAVTLFPFLMFCLSANAQFQPLMPKRGRMDNQFCGLRGRVTGADGQPAAGIRIEVRDARSTMLVETTSTSQDGSFEVNNVSAGNYEVLAQSGASEARTYVEVEMGEYSIDLRLPANAAQSYSPTTSIAALMVPAKAREAYEQARQGFAAGKPERAQKYLSRALQICPNFGEALTLRGIVEMQGRQFQAAEEDLEQAIRD